jgi:hypothetical protein
MLGFSKWSLSLRCPHQNTSYIPTLTHTCYMPRSPHSYAFSNKFLMNMIFFEKGEVVLFCKYVKYVRPASYIQVHDKCHIRISNIQGYL